MAPAKGQTPGLVVTSEVVSIYKFHNNYCPAFEVSYQLLINRNALYFWIVAKVGIVLILQKDVGQHEKALLQKA